MSLENDVKRIADALEKISLITPGIAPTLTVSAVNGESTVTFNTPVDPQVKTVVELKNLAQTIAAGLQDGQIGKFTDFVRNEICARIGVKKLVEIPADRIPEATKLLLGYK